MQLSILRSLSRQPKRAFPNPSEDVAVKHNDLFWFCTPESRSCGAPLPNQHKVAKDAPLKSRQPWENCRRHARARLLGADCWGLSPALPPNRLLRITRQTRRTGRCVGQTTRAWSSSARGRRRSPLSGVSASSMPMRERAASSSQPRSESVGRAGSACHAAAGAVVPHSGRLYCVSLDCPWQGRHKVVVVVCPLWNQRIGAKRRNGAAPPE